MEGPNAVVDVTFVLPGMIAAGGVRAVFEVADRLREQGLVTEIVVPERALWSARGSLAGVLERVLPAAPAPWVQRLAARKPRSQDWFPLRTPVRVVGGPLAKGLGQPRVVVATSWRTAEELARWPRAGERGVYFVQHYETWSGPRRRVDATWRAFDRLVVTSEWLRDKARGGFDKRDVGLAVYGVDHAVFRPGDATGDRGVPVVGFMWDPREWKGGHDILAALEPLREGLRVRAFGLGDGSRLPSWVAFDGRLSGDALADFYRGLDLFVSGSWMETGPMTVPEAMACGVPVVSTDVGNVRLWSGETGAVRIVPPREPDALRAAVAELTADPAERARMSAAGLGAIAPFTWQRTADEFLSALRSFGLLEGRP